MAAMVAIAWIIMFQSTPPHGRRREGIMAKTFGAKVSIHASAREATSGYVPFHSGLPKFQSTPPHGRRL